LSTLPDEHKPLPIFRLCNKINPQFEVDPAFSRERKESKGEEGPDGEDDTIAEGALSFGDKRKDVIKRLQSMLRDLGFFLGNTGPNKDGVDEVFGDLTRKAVREFQEKNKHVDGNPLKVDGLVGPITADALNRKVVGLWYDKYETPKEMTNGKTFLTVTSKRLIDGLEFKNGDKIEDVGTKTGTERRTRTDGRAAFVNIPPPLRAEDQSSEVQIFDTELESAGEGLRFEEDKKKERITNEEGVIKVAQGKTLLALVGRDVIPAKPHAHPPRAPPSSPLPILEIVSPAPGTRFAITGQPAMPVINAEARITGLNPDPTLTTSFEWTLQIRFQASGCPNGRQVRNNQIDLDLVQTVTGGRFTPSFSSIRGGTLTLIVRATVNRNHLEARVEDITIAGTNPDRADVRAALPHDTLRRIAFVESGRKQFNAPENGGIGTCPLFSRDNLGGAGIMQLTVPPPTPDQIWNWRENVAGGILKFNSSLGVARRYRAVVLASKEFAADVDRFNQARRTAGMPELALTLPEFTPDQLDDDAIRGYNGFAGTGRYSICTNRKDRNGNIIFLFPLHEFRVAMNGNDLRAININNTARTGELVWEHVPVRERPQNSGNPNYVNDVRAANP